MKYFSKIEIKNFPEDVFPLFVLSDNILSFISLTIKRHQKGLYNHFMIMHRSGMVATQDWIFREVSIENYLTKHRLKFYHNPKWTKRDKFTIISAIKRDLKKSWFKRLYDPVAIIGQLFHWEWLQIPGLDICSDKGKYLKLVDEKYDLKYPSPTDLNKYLKKRKCYKVFGRYVPD
jgi:hypothetical protein